MARIINDIHCFEIPLKIILDVDEIWITSTLVYEMDRLGDAEYNIMEFNMK